MFPIEILEMIYMHSDIDTKINLIKVYNLKTQKIFKTNFHHSLELLIQRQYYQYICFNELLMYFNKYKIHF